MSSWIPLLVILAVFVAVALVSMFVPEQGLGLHPRGKKPRRDHRSAKPA
ncbi:MAG TPA: hypothetical protein VF972_07930 [Actinomycetota bacterium]